MVRKKAIIITIVSFLTTLFLFTSIGVSYAQQRITATLSAHPTSYSGKCPTTIEFRGKITVTRPGKVQYKFIRSDGAFAPVKTLTFKKAGSKEVSTTWTIGKSYSGWVAIHVLYPRDVKSNKARFKIQCAAQAQLPDLVVKTIKCGPGNKLFLTVANIGNSPLPPGWRAVADIFFDGVKMGHIDLGRPTSGDITPPGGIADYLVVFDIVKPITVKVFVDATNDIKESNERNNTKVAKVKPCEEVALPDLIIEDIDLDRNCQVVVKVKNNGPGIVPDTVWTHHHPKSAGVYLYINGKKWGGATIWKFDPTKSLQAPGGTATYTSRLKVSAATITAKVDLWNVVKETNENNNKKTERVVCKAAECKKKYPNPRIRFDHRDAEGRVYIPVVNWSAYSDEMFRAAPELPPCGLNTNASRTWVNIYDADTNTRLYGFCAFGKNEDLQKIWFKPPNANVRRVYIILIDRACQMTYRSNTISIPMR